MRFCTISASESYDNRKTAVARYMYVDKHQEDREESPRRHG